MNIIGNNVIQSNMDIKSATQGTFSPTVESFSSPRVDALISRSIEGIPLNYENAYTDSVDSEDVTAIGEILKNEGNYTKTFKISEVQSEILRLGNELLDQTTLKDVDINKVKITDATNDTINATIDCTYKLFGGIPIKFSLDIEAKVKCANNGENDYRLFSDLNITVNSKNALAKNLIEDAIEKNQDQLKNLDISEILELDLPIDVNELGDEVSLPVEFVPSVDLDFSNDSLSLVLNKVEEDDDDDDEDDIVVVDDDIVTVDDDDIIAVDNDTAAV